MGHVKRRSRKRIDPNSLEAIWSAGQPPPGWASQPGEHHDEIFNLYFGLGGKRHPHREAWWQAFMAAKRTVTAGIRQ